MTSCPLLSKQQKDELYSAREKRMEALHASSTTPAPKKVVQFEDGQLHMQIDPEEVNAAAAAQAEQDELEEAEFAFLQKHSDSPQMAHARRTLDPNKLYLDSTSSFHQMFTDEHLADIKQVEVVLRGHCNAGTSFSDEKGIYLDLFEMWLVKNGIANLLSLPRLERDGFFVTYDTRTCWKMNVLMARSSH